MRIGITTHNYPPHVGGLETIVRELALGYAREHEVVIVSTAWQDRTGVTTEDGAVVHRLPASHRAEGFGVPYALPFGPGIGPAVKALRSCDVLHAHGSLYATTLLALLARRRSVPLFVTEHVGFVPYASRAVNAIQVAGWAAVGNGVIRRAARVIAYNSRVRNWLAARFGERTVVLIPNGVDTERFQPRSPEERMAARLRLRLPTEDPLGLFVGRAAAKKNLDAVLGFSPKGYRLVVCGAERSLPPAVINLGAVPHAAMADVLAATDFLVHGAVGEGFPVTVQEAMASGLPVALLWDDGYDGSVDREALIGVDSLPELARAAERLAASAALRQEFGARSRAFATRNWAWQSTIESHLTLFRMATCGNQ